MKSFIARAELVQDLWREAFRPPPPRLFNIKKTPGWLGLNTDVDEKYLNQLFGNRSTKNLQETCITNMLVNQKKGKKQIISFHYSPRTCTRGAYLTE